MMNLIEEVSGFGDVFENNILIANVAYKIFVYQEMIGSVKGLKNRTGRIAADSNLMNTLFNSRCLTLAFEDGRKLDFFLRDLSGDVQFSGDFYQ